MTVKNGSYYCDLCKDGEPIAKGTGFWFHSNPFGIEHAHQVCYNTAYQQGKEIVRGLKK